MRDCFKFCLAPNVYKDKKDAKIGDVVLKDGSIVSSNLYKSTMSEPIGIVVSSNSNKVKIMALDFSGFDTFMNEDVVDPTDHPYLLNYNFLEEIFEGELYNGKFPSDTYSGPRVENTNYYYFDNYNLNTLIPYSYLTDINETPEYAVEDLDGVTNTQNLKDETSDYLEIFNVLMIAHILSEEDEIDWYIPSIGELTRAFMHLKEINKARKVAGLREFNEDDQHIWSSTLKSTGEAWELDVAHGEIKSTYFYNAGNVLLFAEI